MKKIIITILTLNAAIIVCIGINFNISKHATNLALKNIEALASGEGSSSSYNICYYSSVVKVGYTYYDCGSCTQVQNEKGKGNYTKCFH
ncbi:MULTISPECIES: NVEALA domain-containing protein [unclassified Butyricimonas]|uniref:NVEALA domain-containing protein n=1 Tax=unclassified Butyricimonas TaxID=2637652 RepID=UPI000C07334D|nr:MULTISPECIES: NVEALA domain-containing protein [unclassified Butyricimonas]